MGQGEPGLFRRLGPWPLKGRVHDEDKGESREREGDEFTNLLLAEDVL